MVLKKIAVILPVYNSELYIQESVDSILNQSYNDFTLYVIDDGSTDDTLNIIRSYADTRLKVICNKINLGLSKCLNKALELVMYDYQFIGRMDADDIAHPDRLKKQLEFLEANPKIDILGTQGYWGKDLSSFVEIADWYYPLSDAAIKFNLLFAASFGHSSVVFKSSVFTEQHFRYEDSISTCEDWDLWVKASSKLYYANLPDVLMNYRVLPNSNHRSNDKKLIHANEKTKVIQHRWKQLGVVFSCDKIKELYVLRFDREKYDVNDLNDFISAFNQVWPQVKARSTKDYQLRFQVRAIRLIRHYLKHYKANYFKRLYLAATKFRFDNFYLVVKSLL